MSETLTPPAKPWLFNASNAKAMAQRSIEVRAARKQEKKAITELTLAPIQNPTEPSAIQKAVMQVQSQIARVNEQLAGKLDSLAWDRLTKAKQRLFQEWTYLTGLPAPGSLKPSPTRPKRGSANLGPIEGQSDPQTPQ